VDRHSENKGCLSFPLWRESGAALCNLACAGMTIPRLSLITHQGGGNEHQKAADMVVGSFVRPEEIC
jgi:hypothetical protein